MEIDLDRISALAGKYIAVKADKTTTYAGRRLVGMQFESEATPEVFAELVRRLKAAEQDAARYRFLRDRLEGAAFGNDDDEDASITFAVPVETVMSASCDNTIDSAMTAALSGGAA